MDWTRLWLWTNKMRPETLNGDGGKLMLMKATATIMTGQKIEDVW